MLKILGRPSSINVRKVLWTCSLIDVPYVLEPWGEGELSTRDPAFLALNPNGLVPVIQDEGATLWESNTICRYLAASRQRHDLLPATALARAQVERWMDWQATELNSAWRYAFMALVRNSKAHTDVQAIEASAGSWNRLMAIVDAQLNATGAFVAGCDFTLADVVVGLSVQRWLATPIAHADLPAVRAYYERLAVQPGFAAHVRNGQP